MAALLVPGLLALLAGCAHPPPPMAAPPPPNPFAYLKASAVCQVNAQPLPASGTATSTMTVRSDDGSCAIRVAQADNTSFASFLLDGLPEHGKTFVYNYNNATYIAYTATTTYAGADNFAVTLVPGGGRPRVTLATQVTVQPGVGAVLAAPPPPVAEAPGKHKTATRHSTKKAVKKKTANH